MLPMQTNKMRMSCILRASVISEGVIARQGLVSGGTHFGPDSSSLAFLQAGSGPFGLERLFSGGLHGQEPQLPRNNRSVTQLALRFADVQREGCADQAKHLTRQWRLASS